MKKRLCVFLALALLLGAAGCAPEAASGTDPAGTDAGKVEDPFVQPSESSAVPEDSDSPEPSQGITRPASQSFGFGLGSIDMDIKRGVEVNYIYDEKTGYRFRVYEGGEMCIPLYLQTQGYKEEGLGVLLFIDGLPQPYRVEGETEYSYMHTFYLEDGTYYPDIYFIPVTGQAGDNLEMWAQLLFGPEIIPTNDDDFLPLYAAGQNTTSLRLQFNATPPARELTGTPNRILSQTVSYEDTTYSDTAGWSAQDLQTKISVTCTTPDMDNRKVYNRYNISADTPIQLRFEVYGSPLVDYRLVYFLDYVPVAVSLEDLAFIEIESGRKTVVETTVDLSGFDGYSLLFPVLVPLNSKVTYDGEAQDISLTYLLMAQTPFQFMLSAASDYQGMLDLNSNIEEIS